MLKVTTPGFAVADIRARAKLDQNEAPGDVSSRVKDSILRRLKSRRWSGYPQPGEYRRIKERFAKRLGLDPRTIFVTAGADQVIQGVFMLSMMKYGLWNRAAIFEPTYPMFYHFAESFRIPHDRIRLGFDFSVRSSLLKKKFTLINLVSPNNPTGDLIDDGELTRIVSRNPGSLVFIDESYGDFSGRTYLDVFQSNSNVILCRSLSKVRLAGIRIGYGIARPEYAAAIDALLLAPYNLSYLQFSALEEYAALEVEMRRAASAVNREKPRFYDFFEKWGITHRKSGGNFVLFRIRKAGMIYESLLKRGVKVRNISMLPGLGDCLRVTIGAPAENEIFFKELRRLAVKT